MNFSKGRRKLSQSRSSLVRAHCTTYPRHSNQYRLYRNVPFPCSGHWDLLFLTLTLLTTEHDLLQTKVIFTASGYFCCCSCTGLFVKLPAMVLPLIFQFSLKLFPHKASTKLSSRKFCHLWLYVPSHLQRWEGISYAFCRTLAPLYLSFELRKRKRC